MKKIIYFLIAVTLVGSCRKADNPKLPDLIRVPTPLVTKETGSNQVIIASNVSGFTGKVVVDEFFKSDVDPQKFDVVITKNGDKSNVKMLQANVSSYPTTVTFSGTQLETLFGSPIKTCDYFDIGVNITTKAGQVFEAFPMVGAAYGAGIANLPGASTSVRYSTKVEFSAADYAGDFVVVEDEWGDYKAGDIVKLQVISADKISFKYLAENATPIIVTVDGETLKTSVAKQTYGSEYAGWTFGAPSVESVSNPANFVSPCDKTLSVVLKHTVSAGSFGDFKIVLKKKE